MARKIHGTAGDEATEILGISFYPSSILPSFFMGLVSCVGRSIAGHRTAETRAGWFSNETVRGSSVLSTGLSFAELQVVESARPISLISLKTSHKWRLPVVDLHGRIASFTIICNAWTLVTMLDNDMDVDVRHAVT